MDDQDLDELIAQMDRAGKTGADRQEILRLAGFGADAEQKQAKPSSSYKPVGGDSWDDMMRPDADSPQAPVQAPAQPRTAGFGELPGALAKAMTSAVAPGIVARTAAGPLMQAQDKIEQLTPGWNLGMSVGEKLGAGAKALLNQALKAGSGAAQGFMTGGPLGAYAGMALNNEFGVDPVAEPAQAAVDAATGLGMGGVSKAMPNANWLMRMLSGGAIAGGAQAIGNEMGAQGNPFMAAALAGGVSALPTSMNPVVKSRANPVEEAALQKYADKIRMTPGQRQANPFWQKVEQGMQALPGSAEPAQAFYTGQREDIANAARELTESASPVSADAYGAGKGIQNAVKKHISELKAAVDDAYSAVREKAGLNKRDIQIGMKDTGNIDIRGRSIMEPEYASFESPIDLQPMREQLRPIYEDLQRSMPVARRQASPAFAALQDIMTRDMARGGQYMNAMDFDRTLGAIKAIAREGDNPFLSSRSQGIAKKIVSEGEKQLTEALGPEVLADLKAARGNVKNYHEAAEMLADLSDEPADMYKHLVAGKDTVYDTLSKLNDIAPKEVKTAGRTFLEGMLHKATAEGGFGRAAGVMADWQSMGPRTKQMLFGDQLTKDLDEFFLTAKRLGKDWNPSGTGHLGYVLGSLGAIAGGITGAATHLAGGGAPGQALGGLAGSIGSTVIAPAALSRLLFTSSGARLLTTALKAPQGSSEFRTAMGILSARLASERKQREQAAMGQATTGINLQENQ